MTLPELDALAILRIGGSFQEAAESSGVTVERVMEVWEEVAALECDCENPEPEHGCALVSDECPVHGWIPSRGY